MVELVLILPFLMLLLMTVLEFGLMALDVLSVQQACYAGARLAALGKPLDEIQRTVVEQARPGVRAEAMRIEYLQRQRRADGGEGSGWQEEWQPVRNVRGGGANDVPSGAIIRVTVNDFPHRMVTGSFFSWLPHYQPNWDVQQGSAVSSGGIGEPVILLRVDASQPRM
jgi:TadE-like protein